MGLRYEIDGTRGVVHVVGTGKLTMSAMIAVVDEIAVDPRFQSHIPVIFDIRQGDYLAELEDGNAFAAALRRREADFQGRFALLVPDSLQFLATLYCVVAKVAGVDRMQCFTDGAKALAWCKDSEAGAAAR